MTDYLGDDHPLIDSGLLSYAVLYRAFYHKGIPATVVDQMEWWQAAASLGFHEPADDEEPPRRTGRRLPSERARPPRRRRRNLTAERMEAAAAGLPPPEPDPTPPSVLAMLGVPLMNAPTPGVDDE